MQEFLGIWKLLLIANVTTNQPVDNLNRIGRILFTSDGFMSATITNLDKAIPLSNGTAWGSGPDKEVANVARPFMNYCGRYKTHTEGDRLIVITRVDIALNPSWIGSDQSRIASYKEENGKKLLTLRPMYANGTKFGNNLIWEKLDLQGY